MLAAPSEKPLAGPESTTISVVFGPVGASIETVVTLVPPAVPPPIRVVSDDVPPPHAASTARAHAAMRRAPSANRIGVEPVGSQGAQIGSPDERIEMSGR